MARALKVFQTHIGFYDLVVAAPSMKAAAKAWGTSSRLFAQGFARQTTDPDAVSAALRDPGAVLKRPHGKSGAYKIEPDSPNAPKRTARQKKVAADSEKTRKRRAAAEERARTLAARKAKAEAEDELAAIEREESELRRRRQALQKKFHLKAV